LKILCRLGLHKWKYVAEYVSRTCQRCGRYERKTVYGWKKVESGR